MSTSTNDEGRRKKVKRTVSIERIAHTAATRLQKTCPTEWNQGEKDTYWWGAFEGYQAGFVRGRK